jgi:predicted small metal-binding protein
LESIAYTWRITPDQADILDDLVRHVRKQLGLRKLDRPPVLDGLVTIATTNDEVRASLIRHLKENRHDA